MYSPSPRVYTRKDFPWADFSKLSEVPFTAVMETFSLRQWLSNEDGTFYGKCPFCIRQGVNERKETFIMHPTEEYWLCETCTPDKSDVVAFAKKWWLPYSTVLRVEMWLLHFVPSQRDQVMKRFENDIHRINNQLPKEVELLYSRRELPTLTPKAWSMLRAIYRSYESEDELVADPDNRIEELLVVIIAESRAVFGSSLRNALEKAVQKGAVDDWKRRREEKFNYYLKYKPLRWRDERTPVRIEYGLPLHRGGWMVFKN